MEPLMKRKFKYSYFDWTKAAVHINEFGKDVSTAEACVVFYDAMAKEEITDSVMPIFAEGNIIPRDMNAYLGMYTIDAAHVKPTLIIHLKNGEEVRFICATDAGTTQDYWPQEAVEKLRM